MTEERTRDIKNAW